MQKLFLYDTLAGKKREFTPITPGKVGMYVCGPTVYDRPHVGNARAVVVYDVLFRLLNHLYGEKNVTYVRNITDVDDKINAAAKANKEPISALTARITKAFHEDMDALNNLRPTVEPRATQHIKEMCDLIQKLIDNGNAYVSEGHVLFAVKTDKEYGKLSRKKLDDLVAGARVEVESYKKDPGDFVLWKPAAKEDDASSVFDSYSLSKHGVGKGRPGWHIECSAMSSKYLGQDFDIHGGGADLKFPHHENEIAQSTCGHKGSHFAHYWVHNGFVTVNGEKMSKSLGNFITVEDLLKRGIKGEVIRYVLLATKYNEPLDFTEKKLEDAKKNLDYFYRVLDEDNISREVDLVDSVDSFEEEYVSYLLDDLNTPAFLSQMRSLAREIHNPHPGQNTLEQKRFLRRLGDLVGLLAKTPEEWFRVDISVRVSGLEVGSSLGNVALNIQGLVDARNAAKKAKNYAEADRIRDELAKQGIILEDSPSGTTWRKA